MKRLWWLLIGLLPFGLSANEMKVPFSVPVDFSKKGTIYETDFKTSMNPFGSEVSFQLFPEIDWVSSNSEEYKISRYIFEGHPQKITSYFKIKITLIPLGWASNDITIWIKKVKKEFTKGQRIEEIVSVPLYGGGFSKTLMIADLQRLRNYHIKVESLEDVELPTTDCLHIKFAIEEYSAKH